MSDNDIRTWNGMLFCCYSNPESLYFAFVFSILLNLLNTHYFNKYLYNNRLSNLAIPEKTSRVEDILSWKNAGIVNVLILSLKMPDKTKLKLWKFCKIVFTNPWQFWGKKLRPLEILHSFFLVTSGSSTSFLFNHWKILHAISLVCQ